MQTRKQSLYESFINIAIGYSVALASQLVIFPLVGIHIPFSTNVVIGVYFTAVSLIRSYIIRRYFNKKIKRTAYRWSGQVREEYWDKEVFIRAKKLVSETTAGMEATDGAIKNTLDIARQRMAGANELMPTAEEAAEGLRIMKGAAVGWTSSLSPPQWAKDKAKPIIADAFKNSQFIYKNPKEKLASDLIKKKGWDNRTYGHGVDPEEVDAMFSRVMAKRWCSENLHPERTDDDDDQQQ